jgi:hypothetical protein
MAARARRSRKTDCDPSTDFNLCACEREYSIEAARRPRFVVVRLGAGFLVVASSTTRYWRLANQRQICS